MAARAGELDAAADGLSMLEPKGLTAGRVSGYQELLRAVADAARWRPAVLAAHVNPERFLRAAHERAAAIYDGGYDQDLRQLSAQSLHSTPTRVFRP